MKIGYSHVAYNRNENFRFFGPDRLLLGAIGLWYLLSTRTTIHPHRICVGSTKAQDHIDTSWLDLLQQLGLQLTQVERYSRHPTGDPSAMTVARSQNICAEYASSHTRAIVLLSWPLV